MANQQSGAWCGSQLFDQAERGLHVCSHRSTSIEFVLRDYELLDGAMAHMVELMGLRITDYDTDTCSRMDRKASFTDVPESVSCRSWTVTDAMRSC